jgi:hypothetical protein
MATPTPTITATPNGTPTPQCVPSFLYLTTRPSGTLAFGNVNAKHSVMKLLEVKNNEPSGALKLMAKIQSGNAKGFSMIGGSCTTIGKLQAGQTCEYKLQLKAGKNTGAVNTTFTVTGNYRPDACPAGDVQNVSVNLAGFVLLNMRTDDSR